MSELVTGRETGSDVDESTQALRGRMGTLGVLFAVLAYNAPVGVFVAYLPVVIGYGNGLGAPMAFIGSGAVLILFAVGFTLMGRHLPNPGAFYAYVTAGLGRPAGLGGAFVAIGAYVLILLGGLSFIGNTGQSLIRDTFHGPDVPWWLIAAVLWATVAVIGYFNIDLSARVLGVALVLELSVIALYDLFVVGKGGADGLHGDSFTWGSATSGSVGLALLFAFTCFGGFEATAIFRDEVRDPRRTIPRATYLTVGIITAIYALGCWAIIQAVGASDVVTKTAADPAGTFYASAKVFLGTFGKDAFKVFILSSGFASVLATHNIVARYLFNLGRDRILSPSLSVVHERHGSPHRSSLATSVATGILAVVVYGTFGNGPTLYAQLVGMGGLAILILLLGTGVAVLVWLVKQRPEGSSIWQRVVAPVVAIAGLATAIVLATPEPAGSHGRLPGRG